MERELSLLRDHLLPIEADLLRSVLEAEGIEAFLFGQGTISALANPGGEIRLVVPTADLERAEEVLAALGGQESVEGDGEG